MYIKNSPAPVIIVTSKTQQEAIISPSSDLDKVIYRNTNSWDGTAKTRSKSLMLRTINQRDNFFKLRSLIWWIFPRTLVPTSEKEDVFC